LQIDRLLGVARGRKRNAPLLQKLLVGFLVFIHADADDHEAFVAKTLVDVVERRQLLDAKD
jgi:hypothetical protein